MGTCWVGENQIDHKLPGCSYPLEEMVLKHYFGKEERHTPVESLEHDSVLSAEVISWEGVGLPAEPLVSIGQVLSSCNIGTELERQRAGGSLTHFPWCGVRGFNRLPFLPECWPAAGGGTKW